MFNDNQNKILAHQLDSNRIKSRQKGNITLSYLEGFDIIDMANKVFGYGNWDYSISKLDQVSQETNTNQNHVICYRAIVKIVVYNLQHTGEVSREDVGLGTGIAKTLADAHESGAKEAVTDGIKRSLRSFGNQFGNSLYDKSNQHKNFTQTKQIEQVQQLPPVQQMDMSQSYNILHNLGLTVVEQGQNLVIIGDDIFSKKDTIKACGFKWDGSARLWYKPNDAQQAA